VHGLAIASEVALSEPETARATAPDLTVRIGEPRHVELAATARILHRAVGDQVIYEAAPRGAGWTVQAPGVASFDVDGTEMCAHCDAAAPAPDVLPLLLAGTGLSFFLLINDQFCLHASAVEVDGRGVAFAGASGRGKTTLAALACAAGYPLFGDDLLRVQADRGTTIAHRGSSEIRLRESAIELADLIPGERRVTVDARTAVRPTRSEADALPLAAIVLPRPDRAVHQVHMRRLRAADAFAGLAECPRLVGWTHAGVLGNEFDHLVQLADRVPVIEARIPWSEKLDPRVADEVVRAAVTVEAQ
jgi:hypothetical protein